jgi:hypothetical protein
MPILGVIASSISGNLYSASFDSIATTTLTGTASSITFSSIPAGYTHLQLRSYVLASANVNSGVQINFNSDNSTNYSSHWMYGNGTSALSGNTPNDTIVYHGFGLNSTYPTICVTDILDYNNTNKFKTVRSLSGHNRNTDGFCWLFSGNWRNTNAISTIVITPNSGTFNANSSFALYGLKVA